jgi:chemotaxis signal transduction protein
MEDSSKLPLYEAAGLECIVGRSRVAIPTAAVQQVIEYDVASPLPLARQWIGGIGIFDHRVLVSVALAAKARDLSTPQKRTAQGVLLRTLDSEVAWALEINRVAAFITAKVLPQKPQTGPYQLPPWITGATAPDGRMIGWIDVAAMVRHLTSYALPGRS